MNRLKKKFDELKAADTRWELGRLLAVLCLVQKLRLLPPPPETPFQLRPESLVSLEQLRDLFRFAVAQVYGQRRLAERIATEGAAKTQERRLLDNQLMWFAREIGADCESAPEFAESEEKNAIRLQHRADLIIIALSAAADSAPEPWLKDRSDCLGRWSDASKPTADWYARHRSLGLALQSMILRGEFPNEVALEIGGYAIWKPEPGIPRVVRRLSGKKASLIEPGGSQDEKVMARALNGIQVGSHLGR